LYSHLDSNNRVHIRELFSDMMRLITRTKGFSSQLPIEMCSLKHVFNT